jgi:hypothetical protein
MIRAAPIAAASINLCCDLSGDESAAAAGFRLPKKEASAYFRHSVGLA